MKADRLVFIAAICLLLAAVASAAPLSSNRRGGVAGSGRACSSTRWFGTHRPTHRVQVIDPSSEEWAGLTRTSALLQRAARSHDEDQDAAIQYGSPAVPIDADDAVAPPLDPLGSLASSRDALPAQRILSRTPPRGPPVFR